MIGEQKQELEKYRFCELMSATITITLNNNKFLILLEKWKKEASFYQLF